MSWTYSTNVIWRVEEVMMSKRPLHRFKYVDEMCLQIMIYGSWTSSIVRKPLFEEPSDT